jgi:adenylyltransferase/sulfurtransferase
MDFYSSKMELTQEEVFRYARHLTIPEVGLDGQRKLKGSSVLVVGTGGLGSPIALYLAGAGIGRIGLVDFDLVDSSNLQRQVIHDTRQINRPKVESARERIQALNPLVQVDNYNERLTVENSERIITRYDLVLDGTDNLPSRYLMNDTCVLLGKPYIYGSVYRFEGQMAVFDARKGPCYRCIFKEPPPPTSMPSGVQLGVFGALPGIIGTMQVAEAIKLLIGIGEPLIGSLVLYDALNVVFHKLDVAKDPGCKICGENAVIHSLDDQPADYQASEPQQLDDQIFISPVQLDEMIQHGNSIQLIDVRSKEERKIAVINNSRLIPLGQLAGRLSELDSRRLIVLYSREEKLAAAGAKILLDADYTNVKVLRGGINAWTRQIDPTMYQY